MKTVAEAAEALLSGEPAAVPFPRKERAAECIGYFQRFLDAHRGATENELSKWTFDRDERIIGLKDPDDGLLRRNGEVHTDPRYARNDRKYVFHFRPFLPVFLIARDVDVEPYRKWFRLCKELHADTVSLTQRIAAAIDDVMPRLSLAQAVANSAKPHMPSHSQHVLRLQVYEPAAGAQRTVGKPHTDRDLFTVFFDQSHPGLADGNGTLLDVPDDHALVFPGDKFAEATNGKAPAFVHQGLAPEDPESVRWSAVAFIHSPLILSALRERMKEYAA